MKDFAKLTRETWKFYLSVLVVSVLFVICNGFDLCRDIHFQYKDDESVFVATGKVFRNLITDKVQDLWGYYWVIVAVVLVLLLRHFVSLDQRTREFQVFLPVKQQHFILHDFLCMTGIMILSFLVMTGIFLSAQTRYNRDMLELARVHHIEGMEEQLVSGANTEMLQYMFCYFVFVFFIFTWIYLGMLLCKNCLAGGILAVFIWQICNVFLDEFYWEVENWGEKGGQNVKQVLSVITDKLIASINPDYFFESIHGWNYTSIYTERLDWSFILVTVGYIGVLLLLIVLTAGNRECSRGKLFYFSWLDYPFSAFCGLTVMGWLFLIMRESLLLSGMTGCAAVVLTFLLIHPRKQRMINDWEVK